MSTESTPATDVVAETPANVVSFTPAPVAVEITLSEADAKEVEQLKAEGEALETERKTALDAIDTKYKPLIDEMQQEKTKVNADFSKRVNDNHAKRKAIADRVLSADRAAMEAMMNRIKAQEKSLLGMVSGTAPRAEKGDGVPRGAQTQKILDVLTDTPASIKEVSEKSGVGYGVASNILRNLVDTERATLSGTKSAPQYMRRAA
jgi:hypothetical protein